MVRIQTFVSNSLPLNFNRVSKQWENVIINCTIYRIKLCSKHYDFCFMFEWQSCVSELTEEQKSIKRIWFHFPLNSLHPSHSLNHSSILLFVCASGLRTHSSMYCVHAQEREIYIFTKTTSRTYTYIARSNTSSIANTISWDISEIPFASRITEHRIDKT